MAELAVGPAPAGTACVCRFGSESGALTFKNTSLKMAELASLWLLMRLAVSKSDSGACQLDMAPFALCVSLVTPGSAWADCRPVAAGVSCGRAGRPMAKALATGAARPRSEPARLSIAGSLRPDRAARASLRPRASESPNTSAPKPASE